MNRIKRYLACAVVCLGLGPALPSLTWAWGGDGHKIIGAIADEQMKGTPAYDKVMEILKPGETLSSVAVWADCVKDHSYGYCKGMDFPEMDAFAKANPEHRKYHYTDVPIQETGYVMGGVGTNENDVVRIVAEAINVLEGKTDDAHNPHRFTPRQALLVIVHMVGDMHQPMHVGAIYLTKEGVPQNPTQEGLNNKSVLETTGANDLFINGSSKNLHAYWDSDVVTWVEKFNHADTSEQVAQILLKSDAGAETFKGDDDAQAQVIAWATESVGVARKAFEGVAFDKYREKAFNGYKGKMVNGWAIRLPQDYARTQGQVAAYQMLVAGKRLAAVLEAVMK